MKMPELPPEELAEIVTGAQKFLAPVPDPRDEERLTVETTPEN